MSWRDVRCGELGEAHAGSIVALAGWVHEVRMDAGVVTIALRDATGVATLLVDAGERADLAAMAASVTPESVVQACGRAVLTDGAPSLRLDSLRVLSAAGSLPFRPDDPAASLDDFGDASPRLRQRWLHLRSRAAQAALRLRARVTSEIRRAMEDEGFVEVETPLLHKPMPLGGNDFLVASRVTPGELFGLPQSPQFYKELLTIGGVDRYYQVARAFRDEPVGPYRVQELTQLDLEMAFATRDDVLGVVETVLARVWRACLGVELAVPFRRLTWRDALDRHGTDQPDLRGERGPGAAGPAFLWVTDQPLFVWSDEWRCFVCEHNPFTAPTPQTAHLLGTDPGAVAGERYDLIADGIEIGGGALRIVSADDQAKVFDVMGLEEADRRLWLGPYLDALETGAPPRGGLALGLDRLVMLALGADDVRAGLAFPKSLRGRDEMYDSPSSVPPEKLREVGLNPGADDGA